MILGSDRPPLCQGMPWPIPVAGLIGYLLVILSSEKFHVSRIKRRLKEHHYATWSDLHIADSGRNLRVWLNLHRYHELNDSKLTRLCVQYSLVDWLSLGVPFAVMYVAARMFC